MPLFCTRGDIGIEHMVLVIDLIGNTQQNEGMTNQSYDASGYVGNISFRKGVISGLPSLVVCVLVT